MEYYHYFSGKKRGLHAEFGLGTKLTIQRHYLKNNTSYLPISMESPRIQPGGKLKETAYVKKKNNGKVTSQVQGPINLVQSEVLLTSLGLIINLMLSSSKYLKPVLPLFARAFNYYYYALINVGFKAERANNQIIHVTNDERQWLLPGFRSKRQS